MPTLTIDGRNITVQQGTTILQTARQVGIQIPTLCYLEGIEPGTSCMLCVVKVEGTNGLIPSCSAPVRDGMKVITDDPQIQKARRTALELLLSDHVGDCMAPCQLACPAHMDIPAMIRAIARDDQSRAIRIVKAAIAMPAVAARTCPAPCQKACRRAKVDESVAICLLKRAVADMDLASKDPYRPSMKDGTVQGKVAIVGGGPAGLAAGYYLTEAGLSCTIIDENPAPGGMLRYGMDRDILPEEILDKEINAILALGLQFVSSRRIATHLDLARLRSDYDAVLLAIGPSASQQAQQLGLEANKDGISVGKGTYQTSIPGVFAAGDAVRPRRMAIRSLADGRQVAYTIIQYLSTGQATPFKLPFNCHIAPVDQSILDTLKALAAGYPQIRPTEPADGLTWQQARKEADRCLHCDCRKATECRLRYYADLYQVNQGRFKGSRRGFVIDTSHPAIIYEPGKCIDCGLCIRIAKACEERYGLTFTGRGFGMKVEVPFAKSLQEGLTVCTERCVKACPTGALALR